MYRVGVPSLGVLFWNTDITNDTKAHGPDRLPGQMSP